MLGVGTTAQTALLQITQMFPGDAVRTGGVITATLPSPKKNEADSNSGAFLMSTIPPTANILLLRWLSFDDL